MEKYKLYRKKLVNKYTILTPKVISCEYQIPNLDRIKEEYVILIKEFVDYMESNLSKENLNILHNNLKDIMVKHESFDHFIRNIIMYRICNGVAFGGYYYDSNKICLINPNLYRSREIQDRINDKMQIKYDLNHELLHMSSSIYDKKKGRVFSGFSQRDDLKKNIIGVGFNEGYTEVLNCRYFSDKMKTKSGYVEEFMIASLLEDVVGADKMTYFYFNANLNGLIDCLSNYITEEEIKFFLTDIDLITKNKSLKKIFISKNDINIANERIHDFLVKLYFRKLTKDLCDNKITETVYNSRIEQAIYKIDKISLLINKNCVNNRDNKIHYKNR